MRAPGLRTGDVAEIHILIECAGGGFATSDELAVRYALEDALVGAGVGEVVDAGSGDGVMDVFVEVANTAEAQSRIAVILKELGLHEVATVAVVGSR